MPDPSPKEQPKWSTPAYLISTLRERNERDRRRREQRVEQLINEQRDAFLTLSQKARL